MSTLPRENDDLSVNVEAQVDVQAGALFEEFRNAISENIRAVSVAVSAEALNSAGCGYAEMDETGITFGGQIDTPVGSVELYGESGLPLDTGSRNNNSYQTDTQELQGELKPVKTEEPKPIKEAQELTPIKTELSAQERAKYIALKAELNANPAAGTGEAMIRIENQGELKPVKTEEPKPVKEAEGVRLEAELTVNQAEQIRLAAEASVNIGEHQGTQPNILRRTEEAQPKPQNRVEATVDLSTTQGSLSVDIPSLGSLNVHADRNGVKGILSGLGVNGYGKLRSR